MSQKTWNPSPSQEAALNLRDKMLLISAAAGSGKTSVLTKRIIGLLTEEGSQTDLSRILVVTFTRAAAAELKSRMPWQNAPATNIFPSNYSSLAVRKFPPLTLFFKRRYVIILKNWKCLRPFDWQIKARRTKYACTFWMRSFNRFTIGMI